MIITGSFDRSTKTSAEASRETFSFGAWFTADRDGPYRMPTAAEVSSAKGGLYLVNRFPTGNLDVWGISVPRDAGHHAITRKIATRILTSPCTSTGAKCGKS